MAAGTFHTKRIYEPPAAADGARVLEASRNENCNHAQVLADYLRAHASKRS